MSSIEEPEEGSAEDQGYFRTLEDRFLELRGRGTLLSADDWRAAREWRRLGIPIDLVVQVMHELFERQRQRRSKRGISSLRYFRAAVESAWEERLELAAGSGRPTADSGPPLETRLRNLVAGLAEELEGREALAATLLELDGPFEEAEARLGEIERALISRLRLRLTAEQSTSIRARADRAVGAVLAALPAEEIAIARTRVEERAIRELFGLPILSLFSTTALGPTPG